LFHLAGNGFASRYEWGEAILKLDPRRDAQRTRQLIAARTDEFPSPAKRPLHSVLNCDRFEAVFGLRLPPWEAALAMAMTTG
jgi:dTDP-4-dehydrorhamnose reductase